MPGHQRIAGKQTFTVAEKHRDLCRDVVSRREPTVANEPDEPTVATDSPGIGRVGNGRERYGSRARKRDDESETEFRLRVGRPAFMGGEA
jgi:hypothetical protein